MVGLLALGCTGEFSGTSVPLTLVCTDDPTTIPMEGWRCPGSIELECFDGAASPDDLFVVGSTMPGGLCGESLTADDRGPYEVGHHEVQVSTVAGDPVCTAEIDVVDTSPPAALPLRVAPLWPPNHRLVTVHIDDCVAVEDRCDRDASAYFTMVTSDEPVDHLGDGSTMPDMALVDCDRVMLRAERQGGGNGRVYTLHWRAEDSAGNLVDGLCEVDVPHDESLRPAIADAPQVAMSGCRSAI